MNNNSSQRQKSRILGLNESDKTIQSLLQNEQFAALSTSKADHPYINLITFAETDDLTAILFCTPMDTRKYENMQHNPKVALMVENSRNQAIDLTEAMAITAIGQVQLTTATLSPEWAACFLEKHPHMGIFVNDTHTALVRIQVEQYILVKNFLETAEYRLQP